MVFINDTTLVVTWYSGHCLEAIPLSALDSITTYAGECNTGGSTFEATRLDMRINGPVGVAYNEKDTVYSALHGGAAIIAINTNTDMGTALCSCSAGPRYLSFDPFTGDIYVTLNGGLGIIDAGNQGKNLEHYVGTGNSFGTFSNTDIQTADDLVQLDNQTWILTDNGYHR